jgi:hypothetical protein
MNWLGIDFVKCDKTENKSLVVTFEPNWRSRIFQGVYDVKLPSHYPNLNEIIFSNDHYDGVIVEPSSGAFVFRKNAYIKTLYLDLETLFTADNITFDLPSNEDIIMHYRTDIILVSPIEHKEFRVLSDAMIPPTSFQTYIGYILYLCKHQNPFFKAIKMNPCVPLSHEVEAIVKIQSEILSNFSEEEIKAMDMETSPLYLPIVMECACNHFNTFMALIQLTNNKETLDFLITSERELSGEAKAIIINRMAELADERSFEL